MTRRIFVRSGKRGSLQEELRGETETFLQPDPRLPAEELARERHVRPRVANVAGVLGLVVVLERVPED